MIDSYKNNRFDLADSFVETSVTGTELSDKLAVGIDLGSTTISATVIDLVNHTQVESYTISNGAEIRLKNSCFHEQDPSIICDKALRLIEIITDNYKNVKSIGITGQMHGIVYIDKNSNAVSNLITWQDKRADKYLKNEVTYCDSIFELTGERVYTGFGFATHYYNCLNNLVPADTYSFCSIMDYLVMKLTNTVYPLLHSSVASSFGMFDIKESKFKTDAIFKLGIDNIILPDATDDFHIVGKYKNIPVAVAIGDNQASFIGAVDNLDDTILVNIGTGSQISMVTDSFDKNDMLEIHL